MGTSKSYITPTKKTWSDAKRAASQVLRDNNINNRNKLIIKYANAMRKDYNDRSIKNTNAISKVISLGKSIAINGVDKTLEIIGRPDLIEKNSEEILNILLNDFCNTGSTIEEHIELDAISLALEELAIKDISELKIISTEVFLKEIIINFINENFKFRFEEKIGSQKSPAEKERILDEITELMRNEIIENLKLSDINNIDFSSLNGDDYINIKIIEAFEILNKLYLEE